MFDGSILNSPNTVNNHGRPTQKDILQRAV